MNLISVSKVGKSWMTYTLALSLVAGQKWFGTFSCSPGRVLILDAELHPETIAYRIPLVANAMGLGDALDFIDVIPLRGEHYDLKSLSTFIRSVKKGYYTLVILDAWYRFLPKDFSENDNADVMALYNTVDEYAALLDACWVNVHHASKGDQTQKDVIDVGSGAGAQSRATDCHLIIRPNEADNVATVEAVVRSWPAVKPFCIRWDFPLWSLDTEADASKLRSRRGPAVDAKARIIKAAKLYPAGETPTNLRDSAGLKDRDFLPAISALVKEGIMLDVEIVKSNRKRPYEGYVLSPNCTYTDEF